MTWHLFDEVEIECPNCKAQFLPFEPEQPCPRCGSFATTPTKFLDRIVSGMRTHKQVFYNAFLWLDAIEANSESDVDDAAIATYLETVEWDDDYLKAYYQRLLTRAWDRLRRERRDDSNSASE